MSLAIVNGFALLHSKSWMPMHVNVLTLDFHPIIHTKILSGQKVHINSDCLASCQRKEKFFTVSCYVCVYVDGLCFHCRLFWVIN